ncbi:hypothetical protein BFP77_16275 [Maribacter sp. 4U21]|uniref:dihydroorotase n=1 Tax=Maribacter sp. 4U21 TaxID=1889779 RepID=UPI000C160694|nr:dihydroorotase [Maribacter sp. 4U21]PIB23857.1 hypothetical protein BFP77_16275 [Maribacter sp. 4U21]
MKKFVLFVFFVSLSLVSSRAQSLDYPVEIGAIFIIGEASSNTYKHIHFPRPNFIIKRGGIVSFKNLEGKKVTVTRVTKDAKGQSIAAITLVSRRYFFGSHKYVKVAIAEAIAAEELVKA